MDKREIKTIGYLTKLEVLESIDHAIMPNTWVAENKEPFPGYHGVNLPNDALPRQLFFFTKEKIKFEKLLRISNKVKRILQTDFQSGLAEIHLFNHVFHGIRIRNLDSFGLISEIQEFFADEGIQFLKKRKLKEHGIIRIEKFFFIAEIGHDLYQDIHLENHYYFRIPKQLPWKTFEKITFHIKNNIDNSNFDLALASVFHENNMLDMVRLYSTEKDMGLMKHLKEMFEQEIERINK